MYLSWQPQALACVCNEWKTTQTEVCGYQYAFDVVLQGVKTDAKNPYPDHG
jgi:hypothetical protein